MSERLEVAERLVAEAKAAFGERRVRLIRRARHALGAMNDIPNLSEDETLAVRLLVDRLGRLNASWGSLTFCLHGGSLHKAWRISRRRRKKEEHKEQRRIGKAAVREQVELASSRVRSR